MNQLGIEYTIFEYSGQFKKKILDFRSAPGNIELGLNVMNKKLGIPVDVDALKEHVQQHTENIIKGRTIRCRNRERNNVK